MSSVNVKMQVSVSYGTLRTVPYGPILFRKIEEGDSQTQSSNDMNIAGHQSDEIVSVIEKELRERTMTKHEHDEF